MDKAERLYTSIKLLQKRIIAQDSLATIESYEKLKTLDVIIDLSSKLIDELKTLINEPLSPNEKNSTMNYIAATEHYRDTITFRRMKNSLVTAKGGMS